MPDNNRSEFILPDIYSSFEYLQYINKNFVDAEILSHEQASNDYLKYAMGQETRAKVPTNEQYILEEALTFLPSEFRRKGVLAQIDIRPLLVAFKDYIEKGNYMRDTSWVDSLIVDVDDKYRLEADAYMTGQGIQDKTQKENAVNDFLENTNGFSPLKHMGDAAMGADNFDVDTSMDTGGQGPIAPNAPGQEPYAGGTTTSSSNDFGITADGFQVDTSALTASANEELDYTQYLQEHATATVEDLLAFEESRDITQPNVFKAGEFITNLTGQVNAVNWADPNGGQVTWNLGQAIAYVNKITPEQRIKLQKSLRDAGYFDKLGAYPDSGRNDEATRLAWNLFLSDSLRNDETPSAYLKKSSDNFAKRLASGQGNLFLDEASVESAILAVGSQVLGRGLDRTELESLTAVVRDWERQKYKSPATGTGPEGEVFSQPDIEARINRYMQETYREETVINNMPDNIKILKEAFG
jgi:hypothetical protein